MCDIACGIKDAGLEQFAASLNASQVSQWLELGLYDDALEGFGQAFEQVVARTLAAGGRIHFNLSGLDIGGALAGDPAEFVGRYTAWELQQILRNRQWFDSTLFYLDGNLLTTEALGTLGIETPENQFP